MNEEVTSEICDPFGEGIEKFSNVPHLIACFVLGYNYLFFSSFCRHILPTCRVGEDSLALKGKAHYESFGFIS